MWLWLGLGAAVVAALASTDAGQSTIEDLALDVTDAIGGLMGKIPSAAQPYLAMIQAAASKYGLDPLWIVAIGQRESAWGRSLYPTDASGTGDWTVRTSQRWLSAPDVTIVETSDDLPLRWRTGGAQGPYAIPSDGLGWGRGLMQLDYNLALQTGAWNDAATNIDAGAKLLAANIDYMRRQFPGLSDDQYFALAAAAYNHGPSAVAANVRQATDGDVIAAADRGTTPGPSGRPDYASDVLSKVENWRQV